MYTITFINQRPSPVHYEDKTLDTLEGLDIKALKDYCRTLDVRAYVYDASGKKVLMVSDHNFSWYV